MKQKKLIITLFFTITIMFLTIPFINNELQKHKLKKLNYENSTINLFEKEKITDYVIKTHKYSKTLEVAINNYNYNPKFITNYLNIDYYEYKNFIEDINSLLTIGYNNNEINTLFKHLNNNNLKLILENDYNQNITSYLKLTYFNENNLERYLNYQKNNPNLSIEEIITFVNNNLDYDFYTNVSKIENENDITILVNKYNYLDPNFIPTDLEKISPLFSTKEINLKKQALIPFEQMCADALALNITIKAGSGFRDYNYQKTLYENYIKIDGITKADTYSARPGYSEHQTGLAIDLKDQNNNYLKEDSIEYNYIINNSYKYGFILRYPKNKEHITGYTFEPWHIRYIGTKIATYLHQNNLTYEEYIGKLPPKKD